MTTLALRYDLRAPSIAETEPSDLYAAALDQAAWADARGFSRVIVSEHHGAEDGYLPSPIVLGAGLAGRTTSMRIKLAAAVVTLHHPVKMAEDLAVLDLVSGGRLDVVVGCGYRRSEYEMLDRPYSQRVELLERAVAVLRQAWTGEPFELDGRSVRVTPRPAQRPNPPLLLAGASPGSARRAARIADGYEPVVPALWGLYKAACDEAGRDPGPTPPRSNGPTFVHVADDPERAWARIAPHALHETNSYGRWLSDANDGEQVYAEATDADAARASGMYMVLTPDECVAFARGLDEVVLHPLMGGLPPELAWESLELVADRVMPALAAPVEATR